MKKKIISSKKSADSLKRSTPKKSRSSQDSSVFVQRIVIITSCLVIAVVAGLFTNTHKPAISQSVAGLSIAKGLFSQATIDMPEVDGAVSFNIYYKKASENVYNNAVRNISPDVKAYTISYLKSGTDYDHRIVAVDAKGKEFWFSPSRPILEIQPM
jgi:hypothetical protein